MRFLSGLAAVFLSAGVVAQPIAAFVLKCRLHTGPKDDAEFFAEMGRRFAEAQKTPGERPRIDKPEAFDDGMAAVKLVRERAGEWGVDPSRVGMIGFSAGAMTTLMMQRFVAWMEMRGLLMPKVVE